MAERIDGLGVLTLATPGDYLKAIGLALSLRVSNPGLPLAVACGPAVADLLKPYFDYVIAETPGLRGFIHKLHLDHYTPFTRTLFFDSDVIVCKPVQPYLERWGQPAYTACGAYMSDGVSCFVLDRGATLRRIGRDRLVVIDGAGHAFFTLPDGGRVFDLARTVAADYADYAGSATFCDEDVMNIVMSTLDMPPAPYDDFFARYLSITPGTLKMDASQGLCTFIAANTGQPFSPCMMHFANNEGAWEYTRQLIRLFRKFGVPTRGLMSLGLSDLFTYEVRDRASRRWRAIRSKVAA